MKIDGVIGPGLCPQLLDSQDWITDGVIRAGVELRDVTSHHQLDHGIVRNLIASQVSGILAIAKDGDAVSNLFDFPKSMGDVEDGDPLGSQTFDHLEQGICLMLGEAAGRFVHDQDSGIDRKGLGDFHHLLQADGQRADENRWFDVESHQSQVLPRVTVNRFEIDQSPFLWLATKKDIRTHIEIVGQIQFLMDQRDAMFQCLIDRSE